MVKGGRSNDVTDNSARERRVCFYCDSDGSTSCAGGDDERGEEQDRREIAGRKTRPMQRGPEFGEVPAE